MNIELQWREGIQFAASDGRGHEVILDGSPDLGGLEGGFRPMEMVLASLASCMAIDVALMLRKARVEIESLGIRVKAERVESVPRVFRTIHLEFDIAGTGLSESVADRCVNLAGDKYCSVAQMLRPGVEISYSHNVKD